MYGFHKEKKRYFDYQYRTARDYIIPFVDPVRPVSEMSDVLEIGCAEAGVLKAFREHGCRCLGIDLAGWRLKTAQAFHDELELPGEISFSKRNLYDIDPDSEEGFKFDLIILKDVIEHIPEQEKFIPVLASFLKPGGVIFFGFPPWYMPFGGHQQICSSPLLRKLPYWHLLPGSVYRAILNRYEAVEDSRNDLFDIKETGISIERFERIVKRSGFSISRRKFWLLNPIYKYKFGKGPIGQAKIAGALPWVRNFITTAAYYLISKED